MAGVMLKKKFEIKEGNFNRGGGAAAKEKVDESFFELLKVLGTGCQWSTFSLVVSKWFKSVMSCLMLTSEVSAGSSRHQPNLLQPFDSLLMLP
jgi:hypothetical protein